MASNSKDYFRDRCLFCQEVQEPGVIFEIIMKNPKNIKNFQPILNYLTGTDPTAPLDPVEWHEKRVKKEITTVLGIGGKLPQLCQQCHDLAGELNRAHKQLISVQCSIQQQTEVIREKIMKTSGKLKEVLDNTGSVSQLSPVAKLFRDLHLAVNSQGKNQVIYPAQPHRRVLKDVAPKLNSSAPSNMNANSETMLKNRKKILQELPVSPQVPEDNLQNISPTVPVSTSQGQRRPRLRLPKTKKQSKKASNSKQTGEALPGPSTSTANRPGKKQEVESETSDKDYSGVPISGSREKGFPCGNCEKNFVTTKELLDHHQAIHEQSAFHLCDICRIGFTSERSLRRHMLVHRGKEHSF